MLIVGENESREEEVSVRKQGEGDMGIMKITTFAELIEKEVDDMISAWRKDYQN